MKMKDRKTGHADVVQVAFLLKLLCFVNATYPKKEEKMFVIAGIVHNVHHVTLFIFVFQKYICILIFIKL